MDPREMEERYYCFLFSTFARVVEDLYYLVSITRNSSRCQALTTALCDLHQSFHELGLDLLGLVAETAYNSEVYTSQASSSFKFTVNTASSVDSSESTNGEQVDPPTISHHTENHLYTQTQSDTSQAFHGGHHFYFPQECGGDITVPMSLEQFRGQNFAEWARMHPMEGAVVYSDASSIPIRSRKTRVQIKPCSQYTVSPANLGNHGVNWISKIDELEKKYEKIISECDYKQPNVDQEYNGSKITESGVEEVLVTKPNLEIKLPVHRDKFIKEVKITSTEGTKGHLKAQMRINWSTYDIVMPSTKICPLSKGPDFPTIKDKIVDNSEKEFPNLVSYPKNDTISSEENTSSFASVLLRNLVTVKPSCSVPDQSTCKIEKKDNIKSLPQKGQITQSQRTSSSHTVSGKDRTVSSTPIIPKSSQHKEVDKDGWEMVKGKGKRELTRQDNGRPLRSSPFTNIRDGTVYHDSHMVPSTDPDLEEIRINEEELRKSYELEEQKQILTKKIQDLETTEIEDEIEGDDHIIVDPLVMHNDYLEYLKSIPWSDQIVEMEKLSKLLPTGSSDAGSYTSATLEQFEELVAQYPARALELHFKFSSRSERKDSEEKNLARRMKADEKRQQLLTEKAAKMRELVQKVEEVKAQQFLLAEERKYRLYLKLKKAEENRQQHLSVIRRKAHDEEEKLKEIAFINELEAQNRRHESLALRQEHEERLQNILEERQRKVDEKAAKEAAVEERRRVLEAERQEKLEKMQEKRRKKEEIIGRKQREKEKERLVIAREKAREREERLQARQAAQLATAEELQKKIQQKQESSARRHEESIEQIRQKALEAGSLRTVVIEEDAYQGFQDEMRSKSDSKGKTVDSTDSKTTERLKIYRKKAKKIRLRISLRSKEVLEKFRVQRPEAAGDKDTVVSKSLAIMSAMVLKELRLWENEEILLFEQQITDITELLKKKTEQDTFCCKDGFSIISNVFGYFDDLIKDKKSHSLNRFFSKVFNLYKQACEHNLNSIMHICMSGDLCLLTDSLRHRINAVLVGRKAQHCDLLMETLSGILNNIEVIPEDIGRNLSSVLADFLGYVLCTGLIGGIIDVIKFVTENDDQKLDFLIAPSLEFFSSLSRLPTKNIEYMKMLESSDLMGVVSLLYCSLQDNSPKATLPSFTINTMKFLLAVAQSDIKLFQSILGAEGMYLQLRHIASYLLTFCSQEVEYMGLLHLVIEIIGYFSVHNEHNQMLLQSGQMPTVLQQLVCLPFKYFCEPSLSNILFPTLIACCHNNATNKSLLENELNYSLLEAFLKTEEAYKIKLIRIFLEWKE